jgi:hypothetical protein|tara:strand:- start:1092 stop:1292 length:201 start_codon:yes stop_codon:yes gene_type:complete
MRIRTNALKAGMTMASDEVITRLIELPPCRRVPKKMMQVHLKGFGVDRVTEWNYNGTVFVKSLPQE